MLDPDAGNDLVEYINVDENEGDGIDFAVAGELAGNEMANNDEVAKNLTKYRDE